MFFSFLSIPVISSLCILGMNACLVTHYLKIMLTRYLAVIRGKENKNEIEDINQPPTSDLLGSLQKYFDDLP